MATIKDVAKKAGVSVATVSRVINNGDAVKEGTKKLVLSAISELNYSPNLLGRDLRRLETKRILVLLNTISNQFYSQVVKGIEEKARENGYVVMVCMTHGDKKIEESYIDLLKTRLVDGAVFLTTEHDGGFLSGELKNVPVVQACEPNTDFKTPTVSIDNEKAAFEAVNYLIENGHRDIAFFGAGEIYSSSRLREKGYYRALSENNLPIKSERVINEGFSVNAGIRATKRLLSASSLPEAIFCISDSVAAGAIKHLTENGYKIPKDISVMGFDNTQISENFIPAITTTKQPQYEIGKEAMELLLNKIKSVKPKNRHIILKHEIIVRDSVKRREGILK